MRGEHRTGMFIVTAALVIASAACGTAGTKTSATDAKKICTKFATQHGDTAKRSFPMKIDALEDASEHSGAPIGAPFDHMLSSSSVAVCDIASPASGASLGAVRLPSEFLVTRDGRRYAPFGRDRRRV